MRSDPGRGGGVTAQRPAVQIGEPVGIGGGDAVGARPAIGARYAEDGVQGRAVSWLSRPWSAELAKYRSLRVVSQNPDPSRPPPAATKAATASARSAGPPPPWPGRSARTGAHEPSRRSEARPGGIDGTERRRRQGPVDQALQSLGIVAVGGSRGRATAAEELEVDLGVLVDHVLMDTGIGETGEALTGVRDGHRRLGRRPTISTTLSARAAGPGALIPVPRHERPGTGTVPRDGRCGRSA